MRTINFKVQIKNEINPGEPEHRTSIFLKFQDMLINFDGISGGERNLSQWWKLMLKESGT